MIALLLLAAACSRGAGEAPAPAAEPTEEEAARIVEACDAAAQDVLAPFDLHFVSFVSPSLVAPPPEGFDGCGAESTGWPCDHLRALQETFADDAGQPVCDPDAPEQCIQFRYRSHHVVSGPEETRCPALWYRAQRPMSPLLTTTEQRSLLREAASSCADPDIFPPGAITVLLFENPIPAAETSFATGHRSSGSPPCTPFVSIEAGRRPDALGEPFAAAVNQHEMGHIFGLNHLCRAVTDSRYPSTNIMQGTGGSCCCECGEALGQDRDSVWSREVCVDCSAQSEGDQCTLLPTRGQCAQPDCTAWVGNGDRSEGFSAAEIGSYSTGDDQITTILDTARAIQSCWCAQEAGVSDP